MELAECNQIKHGQKKYNQIKILRALSTTSKKAQRNYKKKPSQNKTKNKNKNNKQKTKNIAIKYTQIYLSRMM